MLGDERQNVGQPGMRIDVVELAGDDQTVEQRRALAAAIRTGEQPSLAAERQAAQGPLRSVVGEADPTVLEEAKKEGQP
jgi:hypothetical protein